MIYRQKILEDGIKMLSTINLCSKILMEKEPQRVD
jgi:hypothetical protein